MGIDFAVIRERLKDPFFEMRYFSRESIRQRTYPVGKYGTAPDNFVFTDWLPEDDGSPIDYSFRQSGIGRILLASTSRGLCFLGLVFKEEESVRNDFMRRFPKHHITVRKTIFQELALEYCDGNFGLTVPLHMKGTPFQTAIWKQLVRIPMGRLSTYGSLAPNAGRAQAIGSAVGANPVGYIVPCHRVVKSDGRVDGYHWGTDIKKELLAYEFFLTEKSSGIGAVR